MESMSLSIYWHAKALIPIYSMISCKICSKDLLKNPSSQIKAPRDKRIRNHWKKPTNCYFLEGVKRSLRTEIIDIEHKRIPLKLFWSTTHFFEYLSCFALLLMILMNANLFSVSNLSIRFQRRFTKDSCSCSKAFSSSTFSRRSCTNMKIFKVHWNNGLFRSKCLPLLYQMAVSWSEHKCKHLCYFYVLRFFSSLLITIILNSCMLINFF